MGDAPRRRTSRATLGVRGRCSCTAARRASARDEMVRRFQEEPTGRRVFVLSLKAGGTGLNLTAASHVFHFDRWWNPAVEDQATDRAYRIGQTRAVQVHKFVCAGTVEENIDALLEQKRALAAKVVGAGEQWITELGDRRAARRSSRSRRARSSDDDGDDEASVAPAARAGSRTARGRGEVRRMSRWTASSWYTPAPKQPPPAHGIKDEEGRRDLVGPALDRGARAHVARRLRAGSRAGARTRAPAARTTSSIEGGRGHGAGHRLAADAVRGHDRARRARRRDVDSGHRAAWRRRRSSRRSCSPGRCRRRSTRCSRGGGEPLPGAASRSASSARAPTGPIRASTWPRRTTCSAKRSTAIRSCSSSCAAAPRSKCSTALRRRARRRRAGRPPANVGEAKAAPGRAQRSADVKLGKLEAADYDRPREPLPALHFGFESPSSTAPCCASSERRPRGRATQSRPTCSRPSSAPPRRRRGASRWPTRVAPVARPIQTPARSLASQDDCQTTSRRVEIPAGYTMVMPLARPHGSIASTAPSRAAD